MNTQESRILSYLNEFGSITQLEAIRDLGIMRLASRVSDMRKKGIRIVGAFETVKNRYGENCSIKRYRLDDFVLLKKD